MVEPDEPYYPNITIKVRDDENSMLALVMRGHLALRCVGLYDKAEEFRVEALEQDNLALFGTLQSWFNVEVIGDDF